MNQPWWERLLLVKMQLRTRSSVFTCRTPATQQRKQPGSEGASSLWKHNSSDRPTAFSKTTHHLTLPKEHQEPGTNQSNAEVCGRHFHSNNYRSSRAFEGLSSYLLLWFCFFNSLVPFGTKGTSKKKKAGGEARVQVTECLLGVSEDPIRSSTLKKEEGKKALQFRNL